MASELGALPKGRRIVTGTRVAITLSDPWELVTSCGSGPFNGTVVDATPTQLLVELDEPLKHGSGELALALCGARYDDTTIVGLSSSIDTPANIHFMTGTAAPLQIVDEAQTRQEVEAIGTVRKLT